MKDFILFIANIVNYLHDAIADFTKTAGLDFSDKDLHLWVFGILGICSFFLVHILFREIAKYSVTAISFIYTFTVMIVLVFAIEIQQKITGRGKMELDDAVISLWGFLLFFAVFLVFKGVYMLIRKIFSKENK